MSGKGEKCLCLVCAEILLERENALTLPGVSHVVLVVKNLAGNAGDVRDAGLIPGLGRFPWRRAWQPTPVFLPGESIGQMTLVGPWGRRVGHD